MNQVYLDNAATTCMHQEVIDVMHDCMKSCYGNPSSTHAFGREAKGGIEKVRKQIATELGVTTQEIFFTSGGTESNNMILRTATEHLGVKRIISSNIEHKCVLETINDLSKKNITVEMVDLDENGSIDLSDLENKLTQSNLPTLVSLMHANNEIGNLTDLKKVSEICKKYNAYLHSDTIQTIGHYKMNLSELNLDFASCSAHKFHGPKGIGFAYVKKSVDTKAFITGGGQERNMRSGTENVYGIIGMGKAFEMAYENINEHKEKIRSLKEYAIQQLKKNVPDIHFNGLSADLENSLYTVLSVCLPFKDSLIGFELELKGIVVSQGSACSSGAAKVSNVMAALHSAEVLEKVTPLRISFSIYNTKEDVDKLCKVLNEITTKKLTTTV